MRHACHLALVLSACGGSTPTALGPSPTAGDLAAVRTGMDRLLAGKYRLDGSPTYRFAAPVTDRVASWLFEPQVDGRNHSLGYRHGWRVDFWVTPRYVGYPPQPEALRMAFFADGRLRGIFAPGRDTAPLDLDQWHALWVDPSWVLHPAAKPR